MGAGVSLVVFDCDSTLTAVEGIDELAAEHRAEVAALTDAAMRGEVPLEAVYGRRLALIRPTRERVERLAQLYVERLVDDAAAVVGALQAAGVDVRIVSGGLLPAVHAVAVALGVPATHVAAVDIRFDEAGGYAGYDDTSPLARGGGKCDVIGAWRADARGRIMMVGDGVTDLETRSVVDVFVAYAGVVERAAVVGSADVVIRTRSLAPLLPLVLGAAPPDARYSEVHRRGVALLDAGYRAFIPPTSTQHADD